MCETYIIPVTIYRYDIILITGKEDECIEYLVNKFEFDKDYLSKSINLEANGTTICTDHSIVFCWVKNLNNNYNIDLIHELDHAANFILRSVGINHTVESEEAYSYLKTYIQELTFSLIESDKQKKKNKMVLKNKKDKNGNIQKTNK